MLLFALLEEQGEERELAVEADPVALAVGATMLQLRVVLLLEIEWLWAHEEAEPVVRELLEVVDLLGALNQLAMPMAISCTCTNRFLNDGINSPAFLYPKIGYASF